MYISHLQGSLFAGGESAGQPERDHGVCGENRKAAGRQLAYITVFFLLLLHIYRMVSRLH